MLSVGRQQRSGAAAIGQVNRWVQEHLGLDEPISVFVTELACHEPGCPPIETVIALLGGSDKKTWKIPRPAAELSAADIAAVLARPPATTGESHVHRDGCCDVRPKPPTGSAAPPF